MRTNKLDVAIRAAAGDRLVSPALLAACANRPAPQVAPPEPPAQPAPAARGIPDASRRRTPRTRAPAPAPDAPPPTEPSAVPKPRASSEPALESMRAATPSAKMSVAVDLRYQLRRRARCRTSRSIAAPGRRAARGGRQSQGEREAGRGLQVAAGAARTCRKPAPAGVYRQQFSVTRSRGRPQRIARAGDHGHGRRLGLRVLLDPARWRNHRSETGFGKTALTALQRGRVDYAP